MQSCIEAYLDIETTGLSPWDNEITVIGINLCNGQEEKFIQLIGKDLTGDRLLEVLEGVDKIYTYNGQRFDLPFIYRRLNVNLARSFKHQDLMYDCWKRGLYGGFKSVERQLGIKRQLIEINGYEAVRLWWRYVNDYYEEALGILLMYNREDVINLKCLKDLLF